MQVHVAGPLKRELNALGPQAEALFVTRFTQWVTGDEFQHYWFCHKVRGDDGYLYHVHLLPQKQQHKRDRWDYLWARPRQRHDRTSDRYLLYAQNAAGDYLLIEILDDPGAHLLWKPQYKQTLDDYIIVAENFVIFGDVPP